MIIPFSILTGRSPRLNTLNSASFCIGGEESGLLVAAFAEMFAQLIKSIFRLGAVRGLTRCNKTIADVASKARKLRVINLLTVFALVIGVAKIITTYIVDETSGATALVTGSLMMCWSLKA